MSSILVDVVKVLYNYKVQTFIKKFNICNLYFQNITLKNTIGSYSILISYLVLSVTDKQRR